jgi:hypothetical protein
VRERRAKALEPLRRIEPASRNPQTAHLEFLKFLVSAHRFAFYPPAPHVSVATGFLLASALCRSSRLATRRRKRHAMRQNDFCHPNELRAPAPRRVPGSLRHFRSGDSARFLWNRAVLTGGPKVFTTSETASADTPIDTALELYCLAAWRHERGRFRPTASMCDRASDIPVTGLRSSPASLAFACAATWPNVLLFEGVIRVGRCDSGQDRRSRCFVKSLASFRSRTPSTGRDPS